MKIFITTFLVTVMCLAPLVDSVVFECEFKMAGVPLVVLGDVYLCQPTVNLDEEDSRVLENVIGDHLESKTNDDVKMLNIFQQNISFVPKDIADFFPNLKGINFHDTAVETISAEDLKPFPELTYFGMRFSPLITVDSDLFEHTPNLQYITFAGCQIHHVGANLVTHLKELRILDFTLNKCIHRMVKTKEEVAKLNEDLPNECPPWFKAEVVEEEEVIEEEEEVIEESSKNPDRLVDREDL